MTKHRKLTPIEEGRGGCSSCGYQYSVLPLDSIIAVGDGEAYVTKNGLTVYSERDVINKNEGEIWTCRNAEHEAQKDPESDWCIHLVAPLSERHYQRQGKCKWVLYQKGNGFV